MVSVKPLIVHWHQDSAPIYSACFQPSNGSGELDELPRLVTAGGDNQVRVWRLRTRSGQVAPQVEYCATLAKHERAVNCVAFDPSGKVLASAGDDGVVLLWTLQGSIEAPQFGSENEDCEAWRLHKRCRTASFGEIYDLAWSPSGRYVAATSMDRVVSILDTTDGSCVAALRDHKHYVQGVSWDPRDEFLATQSSDQRVLVYSLKYDSGSLNVALTSRIDRVEAGNKAFAFHPESFSSFFRRLSFSPDGSLLVVPSCQASTPKEAQSGAESHLLTSEPNEVAENATAALSESHRGPNPGMPSETTLRPESSVLKDVKPSESILSATELDTDLDAISANDEPAPNMELPSSPLDEAINNEAIRNEAINNEAINNEVKQESSSGSNTNVALVFRRGDLHTPSACLPLPKASCVVRFSPIMYTLRPGPSYVDLPYRMVYAVATLTGVFVYDTQQPRPLGTASNLHYSSITDLAWTSDGQQLLLTSIDGFCSVLRFDEGELGVAMEPTHIPSSLPNHAGDLPTSESHINTLTVRKKQPEPDGQGQVNTLIARKRPNQEQSPHTETSINILTARPNYVKEANSTS